MGKMGLYCKAYPIERFQEFSKWQEQAKAIPPLINPESGQETAQAEENILHGRFLFLQENFTVTQSIFLDEQIIFDQVTDDWKDYYRNVLEFEVPSEVAERLQVQPSNGGSPS